MKSRISHDVFKNEVMTQLYFGDTFKKYLYIGHDSTARPLCRQPSCCRRRAAMPSTPCPRNRLTHLSRRPSAVSFIPPAKHGCARLTSHSMMCRRRPELLPGGQAHTLGQHLLSQTSDETPRGPTRASQSASQSAKTTVSSDAETHSKPTPKTMAIRAYDATPDSGQSISCCVMGLFFPSQYVTGEDAAHVKSLCMHVCPRCRVLLYLDSIWQFISHACSFGTSSRRKGERTPMTSFAYICAPAVVVT